MDEKTDGTLPQDFQKAAAHRQTVTLPLDTDVLDYIRGEYADWQGHIRDLLRFFMETNQRREMDFNPDAFEPGEMAEPRPDMELTL
jgi:hypothetical protein